MVKWQIAQRYTLRVIENSGFSKNIPSWVYFIFAHTTFSSSKIPNSA